MVMVVPDEQCCGDGGALMNSVVVLIEQCCCDGGAC